MQKLMTHSLEIETQKSRRVKGAEVVCGSISPCPVTLTADPAGLPKPV